MKEIIVYSDGSCHTQLLTGAWAAILLVSGRKFVISGTAQATTHNRMELMAVIEAIKWILTEYPDAAVRVYSDSQYVVGLEGRKIKIRLANYQTKAGNNIQNVDLVRELWQLQERIKVDFVKVEAHLKKTETINYNIEVDTIVRALLRSAVSAMA